MMTGLDFPQPVDGRTGDDMHPGRAVWLRRTLRTLKYASLTAFSFCALFAGGFALFASHVGGMAAPREPLAADAIIVLTGGQSRIDVALDLLKSGKGARLLISGVNPAATRDTLQAATGGDKRLFVCCVDIDHAARDTIGNAEESAKWVEEHAYESVILVTNNYHMPRSLLEMRRLLQKARLEPYPVINSRLDGGGWIAKPDAMRVLFTEYLKYLAAVARGVMTPPAHKPGHLTVVDADAGAPR
jgi:uncharacterized SAM-binding protein YcdF (DUF218 family)